MRHDKLVRKKVCNYFVFFDPLGPAPQYRFPKTKPAPAEVETTINLFTERPKMFLIKTVQKASGGALISGAAVIAAELISVRLNMPDQKKELIICLTAMITGICQGAINLFKHWPRKGR